MELLQLRYFFESAQSESFAKTAEKHRVPASSVSASVRRLEKELGCSLFERNANRIILNEKGRILQRSLGTVFGELDFVVAKLSVQDTAPAEIRILVRSLRSRIMDRIVRYRQRNQNVRFVVSLDMDPPDPDAYDLIVDETSDAYPGYQKFELCSLKVRIKAHPDHPLCGRSLTLSQLRYEPFITMGTDSNLHKMLLRACQNAGFTPNVIMEVNDEKCYEHCLLQGIGIGLGREYGGKDSMLSYLTVTDFEERQNFYCYSLPSVNKHHVLDFMEFLRRGFAQSGA